MSLERGIAPDPYDLLPPKPSFRLESDDIKDGQPVGQTFLHASIGGGDQSPQLRWSGFPEQTKGFTVTCYDPDAPTMSGFWHWVLVNLPVSVTELPRGAGTGTGTGRGSGTGGTLPAGAFHVRNDAGSAAYSGPFPPSGDRPHRYVFTVHALDTERLDVDESASPAVVGFNLTFHTIARAVLRPIYQAG